MSVNYGDLECSPYMIARQEAEADYMTPRDRRLRELDREMTDLTGRFLNQEETLRVMAIGEEMDRLENEELEEERKREAQLWAEEMRGLD